MRSIPVRLNIRTLVLLVTMLFFFGLSAAAAAETDKRFGLGIVFGEPTGVSANYRLGPDNSVAMGLAWALSGDNNFSLFADYLFYRHGIITPAKGTMPIYFGAGGRIELKENDDDRYGVRIPIGTAYRFSDPKQVELFGEIVPILDLAPDTEFDLNIGIGARYYF